MTEITDSSPLITPELVGKPGGPCLGPMNESLLIFSFRTWTPHYWKIPSEFGEQIPGDIQFSYIDSLFPEDSGVRYQAPSETPDLATLKNLGIPLSGFSQLDTRIVHLLHACLHEQWDRISLFLAGFYLPFVSVVHSSFHTLPSAINADYEGMDVVCGKDCVKLIPRGSGHNAGRERLVFISGIRSP